MKRRCPSYCHILQYGAENNNIIVNIDFPKLKHSMYLWRSNISTTGIGPDRHGNICPQFNDTEKTWAAETHSKQHCWDVETVTLKWHSNTDHKMELHTELHWQSVKAQLGLTAGSSALFDKAWCHHCGLGWAHTSTLSCTTNTVLPTVDPIKRSIGDSSTCNLRVHRLKYSPGL